MSIHPRSVAITTQEYLGAPRHARHFIDTSPWRLCAALTSNELLLLTYRLPYARDIRAQQFQVQREYLGHLLVTIIVARYGHQPEQNNHLSYEWINDNTGALKWCAENHKCDSEASQLACLAVIQLHQSAKISVQATTHKAGIDMGEIDTMSRIHVNENPLDTTAVQLRCNNRLPPSQYWHCQPIEELQILSKLVDPSILHKHNSI